MFTDQIRVFTDQIRDKGLTNFINPTRGFADRVLTDQIMDKGVYRSDKGCLPIT